MRVHEIASLARLFGAKVTSKDVMAKLAQLGSPVRSPSAKVEQVFGETVALSLR